MNVVAFSTPLHPSWRWRIVTYAGEVVEESETSFPSIHSAVADGTKRMQTMNTIDLSSRPAPYSRYGSRPRTPSSRTPS